jgi:hypothetical protein
MFCSEGRVYQEVQAKFDRRLYVEKMWHDAVMIFVAFHAVANPTTDT